MQLIRKAAGVSTGGASGAPPRLYVLDGLRLFAALAVVSFHVAGVPGSSARSWGKNPQVFLHSVWSVATYGRLGVELFFLISGFVICMSAWGKTVQQFVVSRVIRLFPAYWFSVLLIGGLMELMPGPSHRPSLYMLLTNLTMMQVPMHTTTLQGSYWTLWVELCFYMVFLVVVRIGLTYERVLAFCGIWLFVSALTPTLNWPPLVMFANPDYTGLFAGGIVLFLMYRFGSDIRLWLMLAFSWLICIHQMIYHNDQYRHVRHLPWGSYSTAAAVTACYVVMLLVALHVFDRIQWRWLVTAGALTYPLYVIHEGIAFTLIRTLHKQLPPLAVIGIVFTVLLVASWLMYRFVEKPMARWLKWQFAKGPRLGRAPAGVGRQGL
jgi:peptidoglycan/LPS O-acetylase OafA/YrhL